MGKNDALTARGKVYDLCDKYREANLYGDQIEWHVSDAALTILKQTPDFVFLNAQRFAYFVANPGGQDPFPENTAGRIFDSFIFQDASLGKGIIEVKSLVDDQTFVASLTDDEPTN
jgi:hypothetical protein